MPSFHGRTWWEMQFRTTVIPSHARAADNAPAHFLCLIFIHIPQSPGFPCNRTSSRNSEFFHVEEELNLGFHLTPAAPSSPILFKRELEAYQAVQLKLLCIFCPRLSAHPVPVGLFVTQLCLIYNGSGVEAVNVSLMFTLQCGSWIISSHSSTWEIVGNTHWLNQTHKWGSTLPGRSLEKHMC